MPVAFHLPAADFKSMIELTRMATSTEESRYYLNGIYFHQTPERQLRAVATDGHRLAFDPDGFAARGGNDAVCYYSRAKPTPNYSV
jgi:hypothetical protein